MVGKSPAQTRSVAGHVVAQLRAWGVTHVFGVAGDSIIPLLEAIRKDGTLRYVATRHEEAAALMASAYAKATGTLGVCLAEAGPGAVHLLGGVYDAMLDRVPLLALTGEVAVHHAGSRWPQTIDQTLPFQGATVYNHTVQTAEQVPEVLRMAMRLAMLTPGAVRVGIPKDLQAAMVTGVLYPQPATAPAPQPDKTQIAEAAALLAGAKRPLLMAGRGARKERRALLELAERLQAPIIHTLPALGLLPGDHPLNLGVIGKFGTDAAAAAFAEADVVLVVGTTWWQPGYVPDATFIQIDREPAQIGALFPVDVPLPGEASDVLAALTAELERRRRAANGRPATGRPKPLPRRRAVAEQDPAADGVAGANGVAGVDPRQIVAALEDTLAPDALLCLDVGENTFWISSRFRPKQHDVLLSGHWRTMGFALPAAIAAKLAYPERQVVAVAGDGGFAMTMAEFTTAVAHRLDLTVVLFNNRVLAEEGHLQAQLGAEPFGVALHNPDFAAFAAACGGVGLRVDRAGDLPSVLRTALDNGRPTVVDIATAARMPDQPQARGDLMPTHPDLTPADLQRI